MTHMVIYRSVDNQPVFHQVENLEDAARHVETLRNAGQGGDARIFRMEEVKIAVKTYYRVEVAAEEPQPAVPEAPAAVEPAPPAVEPAAVAANPVPAAPPGSESPASPAPASSAASTVAAVKPEPAGAGANGAGGRFGLFGKS